MTLKEIRSKKFHFPLLLCVFIASMSINCIPYKSGILIMDPPSRKTIVSTRIWLDKITISVSPQEDLVRGAIEEAFTLNVLEYCRGRGFLNISTLPGRVQQDDLIIRISFPKYSHYGQIDPWYFPLSLVTLTGYIWFGGNIVYDEFEYDCEIKIFDSAENLIYEKTKSIKARMKVNLYSGMSPRSSAVHRTKALEESLDEAIIYCTKLKAE
jgi:hypothetical protein